MIRDAGPQDAAEVARIWNREIRESLATFNSEEKSQVAVAGLIRDRQAAGFAFVVAEVDGSIAGFGTTFQFRGGVGYRRTGEHTVMVDPSVQGRGVGRALMGAVIDHAQAQGLHSLFAGVSAANPEAVGFHGALGFAEVARLPEVGRKFDRWIDLILMQKML